MYSVTLRRETWVWSGKSQGSMKHCCLCVLTLFLVQFEANLMLTTNMYLSDECRNIILCCMYSHWGVHYLGIPFNSRMCSFCFCATPPLTFPAPGGAAITMFFQLIHKVNYRMGKFCLKWNTVKLHKRVVAVVVLCVYLTVVITKKSSCTSSNNYHAVLAFTAMGCCTWCMVR